MDGGHIHFYSTYLYFDNYAVLGLCRFVLYTEQAIFTILGAARPALSIYLGTKEHRCEHTQFISLFRRMVSNWRSQ